MAKHDGSSANADNPYINRELSWLHFNRRVLEEAQDDETPLLERAKFLSIVSSNLDEFMSVRVAGVIDQIKAGYQKKDFSGFTPSQLVKRIMKRTEELVRDQYQTWRELRKLLEKQGICFVDSFDELNVVQQKAMDRFFHDIVFPVLTPMAVDQSRPFPLVHSHGLYLAVVLHKDGDGPEEEPYFALVQVPSNLPRYVQVPQRLNSRKSEFMLIEQVIERHIPALFTGYTPISVNAFRLTRNADMTLNEEGAEDLLEEIEKELRKRKWGSPVRLEIERGMHPYALEMLQWEFEVQEGVFEFDGPLDLSFLMKFADSLPGRDQLRFKDFQPVYPEELTAQDEEQPDLFGVIAKRDVLVQHPFESFDAVSDFITQAAHDPKVLAIKITLYRVSGNSQLVRSLALAAEAGKQVTVVVELKARFDEERNIAWARRLEKAGCHVVYGLVGLKTHCKITLVVRQEPGGLRRYVHVGTGNYNDATAKLYTDVGLFTSHPVIGEDASALFNEMTGYSAPRHWKAFAVAPADLREKLFELIRAEADNARAGKSARIVVKINSLSHKEMVDELYAASQAGVKVDLIVRGVCCLRPGVPGLSDNIRVISIVDRFLEHSRIYYFENGGDPKVYISSADWMTRNLTRRIELMCPVFDPRLQESLINTLHLCLEDNVKARELQPSGVYIRLRPGDTPRRSQFALALNNWKLR
ncbi:polyphosphate kinase 1 [Paenibacillus thermotolerans]|uniref:polyphosphate kinase 1 n=1 Tax=Paenibacillus thermotolerans TaxID=3027807 RepID=UPI0023679754|nr:MULTISPECIES: polyphosphate kinase 1 [unclassified Paenibacillus]